MNANACERIGVLMAEWISGELDAEDSSEVRTHLEACASCRTEETGMREMIALLERDAAASSGVADPGDAYWGGFAARVSSQLPARAKTTQSAARLAWLFARVPQLATGLAAAAVLVIALNLPSAPTKVPQPVEPFGADLLVESVSPPSLDGLAGLGDEDLDRLGRELASAKLGASPNGAPLIGMPRPDASSVPVQSEPARGPAPVLDAIGDLSPEELDALLERLDAFET